MHVFLYEWVTGGGLVDEHGRLPASLLAEGAAMISALAADFQAIPGTRVSVLRDMRLDELSLPGCEVTDVYSSSDWRTEFDHRVRDADWTLVIAPEFDAILRETVRRAHDVGGRLLNASDEFIAVASDKHDAAERWRAAGVPAPEGRLLAADEEKLPGDFAYPAVLKPRHGAGSQHMLLLDGPADEPPAYPWPRRLERFHAGRAASVAALCGGAGYTLLPPCWQLLSADGRFTYRGGSVIVEPPLAQRATRLAQRALDSLPAAHGYVGVDLVLGDVDDGTEDVVIEVNPRLTTSYVGLRAAVKDNLALALLNAAQGQPTRIEALGNRVEFTADGSVWTQR